MSLNFSNLCAGLLNRLKGELNLRNPNAIHVLFNFSNAQSNNTRSLSLEKRSLKSPSRCNNKYGIRVGHTICMGDSSKEQDKGKCMQTLFLIYENLEGPSICIEIKS